MGVKNSYKSMWKTLSVIFAVFGFLGVSLNSLSKNAFEAHIALAAFAVMCVSLGCYGFFAIRKWQKRIYSKGFRPIATFVRYSTTDGKVFTHETFRQIQIKLAYLSEIEHKYLWSGSSPPKVTSLMQTIGSPYLDAESGFQVRKVKFAQTRFFNETEVIHLKSSMDDSDGRSQPYVSLVVELPITLVQFRVELLHCMKPAHAGMTAFLERKLKTLTRSEYELLRDVKFDLTSRAFECVLPNPEPGYEYRLRWDKPAINPPRSDKGKKRNRTSAQPQPQLETA